MANRRLVQGVVLFVTGALAALILGGCPPPDDTSSTLDFAVRQEIVSVSSGPQGNLEPLTDNTFHPLPAQHRVSTDAVGEALLQAKIADQVCQVYVFLDTELIAGTCRREEAARDATCLLRGTAAFDACRRQLVQTGSAELEVRGTWFSVSYFPDTGLTLVIVFEGFVEARPILDPVTGTTGDPTLVKDEHFWFTTPGEGGDAVAGLVERKSYPFEELPPVLEELSFEPWWKRMGVRADQDDVPFPDFAEPQPTATPTEKGEPTATQRPTWTPTRAATETPTRTATPEPTWTPTRTPTPDTTPPQVAIEIRPTNPTTADRVTFTATAKDPSDIDRIEILIDGDTVASCRGAETCTYAGGPYPLGEVSFQAVAVDGEGNRGTSSEGSRSLAPPPGSIAGRVTWANKPVQGIVMELMTGTCGDAQPKYQVMLAAGDPPPLVTTDRNGVYEFEDQSPGTYLLLVNGWANPEYNDKLYRAYCLSGVELPSGQGQRRDVQIRRANLNITSPSRTNGVPVDDLTLAWQPYPGADRYRVFLQRLGQPTTWVLDETTDGTVYPVRQRLDYGTQYNMGVEAWQGDLFLAFSSQVFTTVFEGPD